MEGGGSSDVPVTWIISNPPPPYLGSVLDSISIKAGDGSGQA